jgi:hypothetical protein
MPRLMNFIGRSANSRWKTIFYHANSASELQSAAGNDRPCQPESEYFPTMPAVEDQSIHILL